jgi:hypothetical protein
MPLMHNGQVIEHRPPPQLAANPQLLETSRFLEAVLRPAV